MSVKLGEALVYLLGDNKGLEDNLQDSEKKTTSWAQNLSGKVGGFLGGALKVGVAGAAAAIVGIGAAAFAAGMQMDEAMDTIAISTGATGEALDGLGDDFKAVFTSIPTEAGPAADTISELNKRLGLTGESLQDTAKPLLEMTRLLGGDAKNNTALFTRVMGDWSISNEDAGGTLDKIFKASQLTGVGVESLMQKVVAFGSPLRLMGFSLDESIAMFGKWEKEGVNAELVMGSLKIAAAKFAEAGVPLQQGLQDTITKIKGMDDASAALALGMDVFGARAGPDMVAAIREGRFEIGDLVTALGGAEGAIMDAADATADFPEQMQKFKNVATTVLAPLGAALMGVATQLLTILGPAILQVAAWAGPAFEMLGGAVSSAIGALQPFLTGDIENAFEYLGEVVGYLGTVFGLSNSGIVSVSETLWSLKPVVDGVAAGISTFITTLQMGGNIWDALNNGISTFLESLGASESVLTFVLDAFYAWGEFLPTLGTSFSSMGGVVQTALGTIMGLVQQLAPIFANIFVTQMQTALAVATTVWGTISSVISTVVPVIITLIGMIAERAVPVLVQAFQIVQQVVSDVAAFVVPLVQQIAQLIQEQFGIVVSWVQANMPLIQATMDAVFGAIKIGLGVLLTVWNTVWPVMKEVVIIVFNIIKTAVETAVQVILNIVKLGMQLITGDWEGAWETFKTIISTALTGVLTIVEGLLADVGFAIGGKVGEFITAGADLVAGLVKGIQDNAGKVLDTMLNMVKGGVDAVKNFFGIKSPSKLMMTIGQNMTGGLAIGIEAGGVEATTAMQKVVSSISKALKDLASAFHQMNKVQKTEGGLPDIELWVNALKETLSRVTIALNQAMQELTGKAINRAAELAKKAEQLFELLRTLGSVLSSLNELKTIPDLTPFGSALKQAIVVASSAILEAAAQLGDKALKAAAKMSGDAQQVIALIGPTVQALALFVEFPAVGNLREKTSFLEEAINLFVYYVRRQAIFWAGIVLDDAVKFAESAGKVVALIGPAVGALAAMADMPEVGGLREKGARLEEALNIMVYYIYKQGEFWKGVALDAAVTFAEAATKVVGVFKPAIDALAALGTYKPAMGLRETIGNFSLDLYDLVDEMVYLAGRFVAEGVTAAGAFAGSVTTIVNMIKPAVDAMVALASYKPEKGFLETIQNFSLDLFDLIDELVFLASRFAVDGITAAAAFAGSATSIVNLVKPALDAIAALVDYKPKKGFLETIQNFSLDLFDLIDELVYLASRFAAEGLTAAAAFATSVGQIVGLVKPGLDTIASLTGYKSAKDLPKRIEAFAMDLAQVVYYLATIALAFGVDAIAAAVTFQTSVGQIVGMVKPALDTIKTLGEYKSKTSLAEKIDLFAQDLYRVVAALVGVSRSFGEEAVTAAIVFGENVSEMLASIKPAIEGIHDMAGYTQKKGLTQALVGFETDMLKVVGSITAIARALGSEAVTAGPVGAFQGLALAAENGMDRTLAALKKGIEGMLSAMRGVPGQIWDIFASFDWTGIGKGIGDGIAAGIRRGAEAIKAAARAAARAALDEAKKELGIASPSSVMREQVGRQAGLGVALGVQDMIPQIRSAMTDLTGAMGGRGVSQYAPTSGDAVDLGQTNGLLGQMLANLRALVSGVQALQPATVMDARALARQLEFEARMGR